MVSGSPRRERPLSEGCAGSRHGAARRARILRLSGGERAEMQVLEGHPDAQRVRRERALTQILRFRARFRIREKSRDDPRSFDSIEASFSVRSGRVSPRRAEIALRESPEKKQRHRPPADRINRRSRCLREGRTDPSSGAGGLPGGGTGDPAGDDRGRQARLALDCSGGLDFLAGIGGGARFNPVIAIVPEGPIAGPL